MTNQEYNIKDKFNEEDKFINCEICSNLFSFSNIVICELCNFFFCLDHYEIHFNIYHEENNSSQYYKTDYIENDNNNNILENEKDFIQKENNNNIKKIENKNNNNLNLIEIENNDIKYYEELFKINININIYNSKYLTEYSEYLKEKKKIIPLKKVKI